MIEIKSIIDDKYLLQYLFHKASMDTHKNSDNYKNINERLKNYIDFHVVLHDNRPICFAGMYKNPKWPQNIVRVLDRAYFFDVIRGKTLYKRPNKLNTSISKIMLPVQTKKSISLSLIPFYSIQDYRRKKSINLSVNFYNENNVPKYKVLSGLYCTTNNQYEMNRNDWQTVATLEPHQNNFNLPYISDEIAKDIF